MLKFLLLLLSLLVNNSLANEEEKQLLNHLFKNYDKTSRPVKNFKDAVSVEMGLGVQTLESFNQMEESLALNVWLRSNWKDENLAWYNYSNLTFLSISPDDIWTPDVELLNAAAKPEIYTLKGGLNLYNDGSIMYSKPGIYKYSCSLNLKMFPFDKQNCTMIFGNWIYSNNYVNLKPYDDENKQIDILDSFSHSEWKIETVNVVYRNESRDCCPEEEFNTLYYSFILKRYPHYYKISMGMTITLVVVSFIISLMSPDNVSRTGTAVFIPLTILALQLTIADKIPVVGYFTLMDQFFLCCFITSMICSIESGLVYALITTKSSWFFRLVEKLGLCSGNKINNIQENNIQRTDIWDTNLDEFTEVIKTLSNKTISNEKKLEKANSLGILESEKNDIKNIHRTKSYNDIFKTIRKRNNIIKEDIVDVNLESNIEEIKKEFIKFSEDNEFSEDNIFNDVYKVINFDDKRLSLTDKERIIDAKIFKFVVYLDNTIRVILPIVFFSIIIYIFSYEEK